MGMETDTESGQTLPITDFDAALIRALATRDERGVLVLGTDLRVVQSSFDPARFPGLTPRPGQRLADLLPTSDAAATTVRLREVLRTGEPLISYTQRIHTSGDRQPTAVVSLSVMRLTGADGRPIGLLVECGDATTEAKETRRLDLLFDAATTIGTSLDVVTTARQLGEILVPALGDMATVNLAPEVFAGEEPSQLDGDEGRLALRRAAVVPAGRRWPDGFLLPGADLPPLSPLSGRQVMRGYRRPTETYMLPDPAAISASLEDDPAFIRALVPADARALASSVLHTRSLILGTVEVWRGEQREPFDEDDVRLIHELASRAALSIDNARRFTRERTSTVALQRSMLPSAATVTSAAEAAGIYLPATARGREVGGDWYDVIPLPSMRTAVQTLADLDLPPDELLTHLDDLVLRTVEGTEPPHEDALSGTCLYAVYDPVSRRCAMASAGHPPPALVRADGSVEFVGLDPGPQLGVGGLPFEVTEVELAPDSVLAFYTQGLFEQGEGDAAEERALFRDRLASLGPADCDLGAAAARLVDEIVPATRVEDVTLLFAHIRTLGKERVATWEIPADPAAVATARNLATDQLAVWGLDLDFATEIVVSELVTNAIRYAGGPLTLRLMYDDDTLVCEVSDPSNTQPRLRRARTTDEGGRGLLLVAQLTTRWGSRYGSSGKTIWTEQSVSAAAGEALSG